MRRNERKIGDYAERKWKGRWQDWKNLRKKLSDNRRGTLQTKIRNADFRVFRILRNIDASEIVPPPTFKLNIRKIPPLCEFFFLQRGVRPADWMNRHSSLIISAIWNLRNLSPVLVPPLLGVVPTRRRSRSWNHQRKQQKRTRLESRIHNFHGVNDRWFVVNLHESSEQKKKPQTAARNYEWRKWEMMRTTKLRR